MPKNRVNSIGARSQEPTFEDQELSNRIENRLNGVEVDVNVESRSRGRRVVLHVSFSGNAGANVRSGSGNMYHVDLNKNSCTCPDHEHRRSRCRHIEAVDLARERVAQGTSAGSADDWQLSPGQVVSEYMVHEQLQEISNQNRERLDDAFFYTENPQQFEADKARVLSEPVPYYRENVLNGSNVTFGIELEFVNGNSDAIAAELHQLGLCSSPRMEQYHSGSIPGMWKVESDGSVTRGRRGGEIISPILQDTPETWRQLETICEVARRHGAQVNFQTGGHVHIGAEPALDGKRQRWRRFFKMAAGFEMVYFKLSGGEQGHFRGGGYTPSSRNQNRRGISVQMPEEGATSVFQGVLRRISAGKYQSINLQPFSSKKTIEFRAFNGSLNPGIIQANVKYAAGLINSAERSRTQFGDGLVVTAQDRKRGKLINQYERLGGQSDEVVMKVLDTVCSRKEDKEHLLAVLVRNDWT